MQANLRLDNAAITPAVDVGMVLMQIPLLDKGTHSPTKGSYLIQPKAVPSP